MPLALLISILGWIIFKIDIPSYFVEPVSIEEINRGEVGLLVLIPINLILVSLVWLLSIYAAVNDMRKRKVYFLNSLAILLSISVPLVLLVIFLVS